MRPRDAVSLIAPVPVPVPVVPVPDIDPDAPAAEVSIPVPVVPAAPVPVVPDVPTSPPLVAAVLSRWPPPLQAPTASTVASASMLLPKVTLRMFLSPYVALVNVAALPAGGHPNRDGATQRRRGRKTGANVGVTAPPNRVAVLESLQHRRVSDVSA
jgi:hypothetical protein